MPRDQQCINAYHAVAQHTMFSVRLFCQTTQECAIYALVRKSEWQRQATTTTGKIHPKRKQKLLQQSNLSFFIKKHQDEEAIKDINEDNDSNMSANSKETKENEQSTFANEDDSNSTRRLIDTCNTSSSTIGYPSGASADSQKIESLDYSISTKFSSNFYYFKLGGEIKGRSYVRCDSCYNQQATIKTFRKSKRIPAICTSEGTIPRKEVLDEHLRSEMHAKAVEAEQASRLTPAKRIQKSQLGSTVAKASAQLQNKIAKLMINVFNDAKKLTLSAWSWPSREANMIAAGLDFQEEFSAFNPPSSVFQYITPSQHKAFLKFIVVADQDNVKSKLEKCLALSLRCDGSVDRRRIDNCHVIAKIINQEGKLEVLFPRACRAKRQGHTRIRASSERCCIHNFGLEIGCRKDDFTCNGWHQP